MGQNGYNFVMGQIGNQGIKQRDTFFTTKTGKIGVGLGAAFGTVNDKNFIKTKPNRGSIL